MPQLRPRRRTGRRMLVAAAATVAAAPAAPALAGPPVPPAYDHIVVVVEENESFANVVGSASAPHINNTLIPGGVSFTNFYGITHPSQPNYFQLYAGSNQGVTTNTMPASTFTSPNLGAALGPGNFVGYAEDLPAVGSQADTSGLYARKHAPWTNWQGTGTNQTPSTISRPFFAVDGLGAPVPTKPFFGNLGATTDPGGLNFAALPKVTMVVPNLVNDMHDGTYPSNVQAGDTWLQQNLGAYATWAKTHNSLLVVTFDEDNGSAQANKVATVFYGANLRDGSTVASTYTLHNLLRTVEDSAGASYHSGMAANVKPVHGTFAGQTPGTIATFQQGLNGYAGAHDTVVREDQPTTAGGSAAAIVVDADLATVVGSTRAAQALVRFDNVVGTGAGQVPAGANVLSAKLVLKGSNDTVDNLRLYRMRTAWDDATATWNSLAAGVSPDGVEAASTFDFEAEAPLALNVLAFDVTDTVQAWANGTLANLGWAILPTGTDGYQFNSAEVATLADRPYLEVTYAAVPEPGAAAGLLALAGGGLLRRRRRSASHSRMSTTCAS